MKNIGKVLALSSVLIVSACENASNTVITIPSVRVGCTSSDSASCSSANPNPVTAFVRMTRSGCESLNFDPVATGSKVMSCDASGCEVTISTWTDPESFDSVTEIMSGTMDLCTQVDLDNSSGLPNTNDLVNEDSRNLSSSDTLTVDGPWEEI